MDKAPAKTGWAAWSAKKKATIISIIVVILVALGVGLGVGLHHGTGGEDEGNGGSGNGGTGTGGNGTTTGNGTVKWQPAVGVKWQIVLLGALNDTSVDADVYDIDLFDNNRTTISTLHDLGRKVICYFSAGTYEDWRPDAKQFDKADLGNALSEWRGEKWLNTNSDGVRKIMQTRLDMAVTKGCDGVDPDNIDAYDNSNGLKLTEDDAINYVNWLAGQAHGRNLSVGLKNGGSIIDNVLPNMQWSVNEQCAQYTECDTYAAFTDANKPVFHIEYPKGNDENNNKDVTTAQKSTACNAASAGNFSTVIKNMDLDSWVEYCS
ncbi:hypothetical protein N7539_009206 [Penicillium diatomitis]|uniref:alpha-galactosidase n=1 Tax=Penicillium diatomitis TaxID=2819901 RepID=A0A9W9WLD9_9EURO|nr:uncharacterized protein N7539_009206 [Penicillium diatomitis]KAJ5469588.1 hypothetical protein N7539_009206 [Penicillium diatomitis]